MDVVVPSIWLSSFAGALLFYAGGWLTPRPRASPAALPAPEPLPPPPPPAPSPAIEAEIEAERDARVRAEQETRGAVSARDEAVAALATERGRSRALREELAGERDARTRADAEAAQERRRLVEQATRLGAEVTRLGAEVTRLGAHASGAAGELEKARADLAKARTDLAKARTAAAKAPAPAPDLAELQRRNVEVSMKLRALEQRAQEVSRKDAENADLRRRVEALTGAAAEAEALRARLRDLEAQGYARRVSAPRPDMEEVPVSEGKPELETSLALGLRELCLHETGCRAVVLSDMRGLLIAAYGDAGHRAELAAAASLTTTMAERMGELLPLGGIASVVVVDDNDLMLRTRWLRGEEECFLLSTLGARAPADDAAASALRAQLFALIGAA